MTTETEKLIAMVAMFVRSDENKCWPTVKRWSVKEAKEALRYQLRRVEDERPKA